MLIPISCPQCRHGFKVDSSFIGAKRKCPSCDVRFLLTQSIAEQEGAELDHLRGRKAACPECLRTFIPMLTSSGADLIPCRFCDHKFDVYEGWDAFEVVGRAEKVIRKGLLLGVFDSKILAGLPATGVLSDPDTRRELLESQLERLPYLRYEVLTFGGRETPFIRPRHDCDLCRQASPEETVEIVWRLTQKTRDRSAGSLVRGLLIPEAGANVQSHNSDKTGIYFLCRSCREGLGGNWKSFWKGFLSLPYSQDDDFKLHSIRACVLNQTESGTTLEYE